MKQAKMTKQVKEMVKATNEYLKREHIKDTGDTAFSMMCFWLLQANCYHGYNYFTVDGRLSGGDNENFDHLEIYIV